MVEIMKNFQTLKPSMTIWFQGWKRDRRGKHIWLYFAREAHILKVRFSLSLSVLWSSPGARYTVLYVSDPLRPVQYPSYREVERFLAESASGHGSFNSTSCDGVCLVKSSLLEGILVGIVLLIILISGLCCMAGIDTPTRFETPQDS